MSETKTQDWFVSFVHAVNNSPNFSYGWMTFSVEDGSDMKRELRETTSFLERRFPGETVSLLSVTRL